MSNLEVCSTLSVPATQILASAFSVEHASEYLFQSVFPSSALCFNILTNTFPYVLLVLVSRFIKCQHGHLDSITLALLI